jgi:protein-S-isoprenylcysteine O-methyltransferase Ste14
MRRKRRSAIATTTSTAARVPAGHGAAGTTQPKDATMGALLSFLYGVVAYGACVAALLYLIGFSGNVLAPKSVDVGASAPMAEALCINVLLLGLFAVQHSTMARRAFKRWWTRIVPPAVERSTYVLATSFVLALLVWQWRPIPAPILWRMDAAAAQVLWAVFWLGWALVLVSTFLINHFELFGLHQVFARLTGRGMPASQFVTPLFYRYVRHPLYLGLLLSFWSVPVMTAGHLLFSLGATGYIFVGIWFEERDLIVQFGERYRRYRAEVGMLVPRRHRL